MRSPCVPRLAWPSARALFVEHTPGEKGTARETRTPRCGSVRGVWSIAVRGFWSLGAASGPGEPGADADRHHVVAGFFAERGRVFLRRVLVPVRRESVPRRCSLGHGHGRAAAAVDWG